MGNEKKIERLNEEKLNNQGCLMKIVEYNSAENILIEFQDEYKFKTITDYNKFLNGKIKNPYYPSVCGVGIIGIKYPVSINYKHKKEYIAWKSMLTRCFNEKNLINKPAYKDVTCCKEWFLYEEFYEWIHKQENFNKWFNGERWTLDKDILVKGNKVYSPDTCCLVPQNVNILFTKSNLNKRNFPIGVKQNKKWFSSVCHNPFLNKSEYIGTFSTPEEAFYDGYKPYKENIIKQIAKIEYTNGNITEKCYQAMMNYEVEITD